VYIRHIRIGIITRKRFTPQPADRAPREHLANRQTMRPKVKRAPLKSSPARTNPPSVVITKSKRFTRLDTRTNLTRRTFPFPDPGLAVGSDSHEVPFYRVNALSSDGFIGEGSNGTRGIENDAFALASRFFSQGPGFPLWSGQGAGGANAGMRQGVAKGRPPSPRARSRPRKTNFAIRIRLREIWKLRFKGRKMTRRWRPL